MKNIPQAFGKHDNIIKTAEEIGKNSSLQIQHEQYRRKLTEREEVGLNALLSITIDNLF